MNDEMRTGIAAAHRRKREAAEAGIGLEPAMVGLLAALPKGWQPLIGREERGWWATASTARKASLLRIISTSERGVLHPRMVDAVLALVVMLRERAEVIG